MAYVLLHEKRIEQGEKIFRGTQVDLKAIYSADEIAYLLLKGVYREVPDAPKSEKK